MKNFALIGAGPLTGLATARRFGRQGYRVAMIARRRESLDELQASLAADGIEAQGFVGDVADQGNLARALAEMRDTFGPIDTVLYTPHEMHFTPPSRVTVDAAREAFDLRVAGLITTVQELLPGMLQRGEGSLLAATGRSAIQPMKALGDISLSTAALRAYIYELHDELKTKGIYAGLITISGVIDDDLANQIAPIIYDLHQSRDRIEAVYGEGMEVHEEIAKLTQRTVDEFLWPESVEMS